MKLNAPKSITWIIATVFGGLSLLFHFNIIHASLPITNYWLMAIAFFILWIAAVAKGL